MLKIVAVAFCVQWVQDITLQVSAAPITKYFVYKKQTKHYNPNMGYEPYWTQGEWVFELPRDRNMSISTTKWPLVCGEECVYLYKRIGKVCTHLSTEQHYSGCSGLWAFFFGCDGAIVDDISGGFYTFDTYCKFLDAQCHSYFNNKWVFVHVGPCLYNQELWYKPMGADWQAVSRLGIYMTSLFSVFDNITATPFI